MANPVPVECPADVWTKVATAVPIGKSGIISINKNPGGVPVLATYRDTNDAAPTDQRFIDSSPSGFFIESDGDEPIDVYLNPKGAAISVEVAL